MPYQLKVYSNSAYMDEEEARLRGNYETYEQAVTAAKSIVREFLLENYTSGMQPDSLMSRYSMYGEDPVIVSKDSPLPEGAFSGWQYAKTLTQQMCAKLNSE